MISGSLYKPSQGEENVDYQLYYETCDNYGNEFLTLITMSYDYRWTEEEIIDYYKKIAVRDQKDNGLKYHVVKTTMKWEIVEEIEPPKNMGE